LPLVIIAILTSDRLLPPILPWIVAVSACSCASLKEDEPTMELAPPTAVAGDELAAALVAGAAAELLATAAELLATAAELLLLLLLLEHAVTASSAPALAAIPAANFLFMHNLLVTGCKGQPEAAEL
jgi:hypothetical protein